MTETTRRTVFKRAVIGGLVAAPLAMPAIVRAQSRSTPVRIGLLSDMSGPYREIGGPGNHAAVEMVIEDFGGSVLHDFCTELTQLSGTDAYRPLHEGGCPLMGREG